MRFDALAQFHNLRLIALDLELGIHNIGKPRQPILNRTSAKELFSYMLPRKEGARLKSLTLVVGENSRRIIAWTPDWRRWEMDQAASFEMRDGGRGEIS